MVGSLQTLARRRGLADLETLVPEPKQIKASQHNSEPRLGRAGSINKLTCRGASYHPSCQLRASLPSPSPAPSAIPAPSLVSRPVLLPSWPEAKAQTVARRSLKAFGDECQSPFLHPSLNSRLWNVHIRHALTICTTQNYGPHRSIQAPLNPIFWEAYSWGGESARKIDRFPSGKVICRLREFPSRASARSRLLSTGSDVWAPDVRRSAALDQQAKPQTE